MWHIEQKSPQNIFTVVGIWYSNLNFSIQSTRSAKGWVYGVWTVSGRQKDHVTR